MTNRLDSRTALITGATGGIGRATAELFAREGARLVLTDIDDAALAELGDRLTAAGAEVLTLRLDVSSAEEWSRTVTAVRERFGALHVLVTLAGVVDWPGIEDTREQDWDRVIAVNQKGTWLAMRAAMPLLRESGDASVVTTSSVLGLVGSGAAAAYQASKGAVAGWESSSAATRHA